MHTPVRTLWRAAIALTLSAAAAAVAEAADLEMHHADFHARLGMKIYVQTGKASRMHVELTDGKKPILMSGKGGSGGLGEEEVITLDFRDLPKGKYTLTVELSDGRKAVRTWTKPYDGVPRVGIDENNAICIEGNPFFPVAPWFVAQEAEIKKWSPYVNTLNGVGFSRDRYSIAGHKAFLDLCTKYKKMAISPGRSSYWPNGGKETGTCYYTGSDGKKTKDRKADINGIAEYVKAAKDHPALRFWHWKDEPELDSAKNCIPPAEVRKWTEKCHELDPQHPVFLNTGGGKFGRPVGNWGYEHIKTYTYHHNGISGSQKVLLADVISQDYYPIENANDKNYKISIENMTVAMDRMAAWNHNLAPFMSCVETCDIRAKDPGGPPTPTELRLLCWANIIHGARGIIWFHHFTPTPEENFKEMARFLDQVTRLTPMVCAAKYGGKVEKKEQGDGRVDIMVTQLDGDIYLFAANLKRKAEKVEFAVDVAPRKIEVLDEKRTIKASGKKFSDNFAALAVHIYKISR